LALGPMPELSLAQPQGALLVRTNLRLIGL